VRNKEERNGIGAGAMFHLFGSYRGVCCGMGAGG
jgi:hypothetical protein